MKNSSNELMESVFDTLSSVKTVAPDGDLYWKTVMRIDGSRGVPTNLVRAVAAVFLLFLSAEVYVAMKKQNQADAEVVLIVCETNNQLYHE